MNGCGIKPEDASSIHFLLNGVFGMAFLGLVVGFGVLLFYGCRWVFGWGARL